MSSVAIIRDQIIRRLSGGDPQSDTRLKKPEVELYILQVLNAAIKIEYFTNIKAEDVHGVSGQYVATYVLDVFKDTIRKEDYIELPQPFISLPNDKGLNQITPLNGKCRHFIPVKVGFNALYGDLAAGNLEKHTGFYPERNKVFFTKDIKSQGTTKVMVKIIAAVGLDTVIDPGMEQTIVEQVIGLLTPRLQQDKVVDNVDTSTNE